MEESWDGALLGYQMEDLHRALPSPWEPLLKGDVFVNTLALERLLGGGDWMAACPDELGPLGTMLKTYGIRFTLILAYSPLPCFWQMLAWPKRSWRAYVTQWGWTRRCLRA